MNIENVRMTVEPVGDFALKGLHRSISAYNVLSAVSSKVDPIEARKAVRDKARLEAVRSVPATNSAYATRAPIALVSARLMLSGRDVIADPECDLSLAAPGLLRNHALGQIYNATEKSA